MLMTLAIRWLESQQKKTGAFFSYTNIHQLEIIVKSMFNIRENININFLEINLFKKSL